MAQVTGGEKLRRRLAQVGRRLGSKDALRVGFLEGATYPDGTSVAEVATFNEYGTSRAPPRPFIRPVVRAGEKHWGKDLARALRATNMDARRALGLMGEQIAGEIRQSITSVDSPPLAPSTVRAKGFDKPLIDTGHMLNSVDYEVR